MPLTPDEVCAIYGHLPATVNRHGKKVCPRCGEERE